MIWINDLPCFFIWKGNNLIYLAWLLLRTHFLVPGWHSVHRNFVTIIISQWSLHVSVTRLRFCFCRSARWPTTQSQSWTGTWQQRPKNSLDESQQSLSGHPLGDQLTPATPLFIHRRLSLLLHREAHWISCFLGIWCGSDLDSEVTTRLLSSRPESDPALISNSFDFTLTANEQT